MNGILLSKRYSCVNNAELLCLCVVLALPVCAQDKDAVAVVPPSPDKSGVESDAGVKAVLTPEMQRAQAAIFVEPDKARTQVRLVGVATDVAKRYRPVVPPLPIPPFTHWRQWFRDHEESVHCALEWRNEKGEWFHGELRSSHFDANAALYRVGAGEFPGTAYDAYGVYIIPGRVPREKDVAGRPVTVTVDQEIPCDYRQIEAQIRKYAAKDARPGAAGTGGRGKENVGLGGPAYKPSQNSNTMIKFVLRACGCALPAPDRALGWDTEPEFPYSSDADAPPPDGRP